MDDILDIEPIYRALRESGYATSLFDGRYFFVCVSKHLGIPGDGICVGLQSSGFMVWDGVHPVNQFDLLGAGFNLDISPVMGVIINKLHEKLEQDQHPVIEIASEEILPNEYP